MIYIIVFLFTTFFTYVAQRTVSQKVFFYFFSALAVLFPAMLAGFRDSGIGTDTLIYVDHVWAKILLVPAWDDFMYSYSNKDFQDIEFLYLLLNWLVSQVSTDVHSIYFAANLVVIYFVYRAAYDNRKKCDMWLVMLLFLLLYYNASLNLVRQSIALSMSIYAYKYIEREKWVKVAIWSYFVLLAHNTGVFFTFLWLIYLIFRLKSRILKRLLLLSFAIIVPVSLSMLDYILFLSVNLGILPEKFLMYMGGLEESALTKSAFIIYILFGIFLFGVWRFFRRVSCQLDSKLSMYAYFKFIGVLLFIGSLVSRWAFRVSYYINYPADCLFLPRAAKLVKRRSFVMYKLSVCTILLLAFVLWIWSIVIKNDNATIPYKSQILGI